jgi:hypothetical protein
VCHSDGVVKRLKLMWDYDAFPLWEVDDEEPWGDDAFPISGQLRKDLQAWSDQWTAAMFADGGPTVPGWTPPRGDTFRPWDEKGRQLLRRVREELGPNFIVGYFNEKTEEIEWPQNNALDRADEVGD